MQVSGAFSYTATSALVVCRTNSSCLRLSEFDLCLLSSVGPPYSSGLSLFQKTPPGRKMELSSKIHFICCPCLGDPSPALLVVRCPRHKFLVFCPIFLVAYNCQASQQLQSILLCVMNVFNC